MVTVAATFDDKRLEDIARRLDEYTLQYERRRDSRCVFTHAYSLITRLTAKGLETNEFADPGWIVALAEAFAEQYFAALEAYDRRRRPPVPWKEVFDTLSERRSSVLEDLVSAIVVHLVHDLPLALVEVGLLDSHGRSHIGDFHLVNDVLGTATGEIQEAVSKRYDPYLRWLDRLAKDQDEVLTNYGFRVTRGVAWYNASRLLDPASQAAARQAIAESPQIFLASIFNPPVWSVRTALRAVRLVARLGRRWPAGN